MASTMSAFILMMQVFIEPIAKYTKNFDVGAWTDSAQLIENTEKVRKALAMAGQANQNTAAKAQGQERS